MTLKICHSLGTDYAIFKGPSFQLTYRVNEIGCLARATLSETQTWDRESFHSLSETDNPYVSQVNFLISKTVTNIQRICAKFGISIEGNGIECYENFTALIRQEGFDHLETLDLSGAEIDLLPFHIALFKRVKVLDLSNNKLRILPPELLNLPQLETINLMGNPLVSLPAWLADNPQWTIFRDEVKCRPEHLAQRELTTN